MSAAAPQQAEQAQAQIERPFPTTHEELHLIVAEAVGRILSFPENIQQLAMSVASAQAGALQQVNIINQRMEAHPQLVRVEYPGAARATVVAAAEGFDVVLEERDGTDGWKPLERPDYVIAGAKKLVLSQVTHDGDVWFITTTAEVHKFQDSMIGQNVTQG
jgi:hypothetical protein